MVNRKSTDDWQQCIEQSLDCKLPCGVLAQHDALPQRDAPPTSHSPQDPSTATQPEMVDGAVLVAEAEAVVEQEAMSRAQLEAERRLEAALVEETQASAEVPAVGGGARGLQGEVEAQAGRSGRGRKRGGRRSS